jgi:uncharacterized protein YndB with AHSA1/START domain
MESPGHHAKVHWQSPVRPKKKEIAPHHTDPKGHTRGSGFVFHGWCLRCAGSWTRERARYFVANRTKLRRARDKVFGLWTDPQPVAQWFLPPENARWTEAPTFAARPGGDFRLRLIARDELYICTERFAKCVRLKARPQLAVGQDSPLAGSPGDTEVTVEVFARGGRTDLVLTQRAFRNGESRGQYEHGWNRCFREMEKLLNSVPPETLTRWKDFILVSSPVVALEHATVIDGTGAPAKRDQSIVFSDGRITALGPSGSVEVPANAQRLGLTGYTALPGLVGMHDHLFYLSNFFNTDDRLAHVMPFSYPRLYLASGVTTIRTTGSFEPYADLDIKFVCGTLIGPRCTNWPHLTGRLSVSSTVRADWTGRCSAWGVLGARRQRRSSFAPM